jgi:hypothetical protein
MRSNEVSNSYIGRFCLSGADNDRHNPKIREMPTGSTYLMTREQRIAKRY